MICASTSEFIFIQIAAGRPCVGVLDLLADVVEDAVADAVRTDRDLLELRRLAVAGNEVEDARHVARDGADRS